VWEKSTQGLLLSAVYWGYMSSMVIASFAIYRFGSRKVCALNVFVMSLLCMLCHPASHWSPWAVFVLRVGMGINTVSRIFFFFFCSQVPPLLLSVHTVAEAYKGWLVTLYQHKRTNGGELIALSDILNDLLF
jgi:MFS family permease